MERFLGPDLCFRKITSLEDGYKGNESRGRNDSYSWQPVMGPKEHSSSDRLQARAGPREPGAGVGRRRRRTLR